MYPSTHKFEREIVRFTAQMLHGDNEACGSVTSGGSESILMAIKASRDWFLDSRGGAIGGPPVIICCTTGHPALNKAAWMFGMEVRRLPTTEAFTMDVEAVKRNMDDRVCLIYASAPCFPQGVMDPIGELGAVAQANNVCLHVDCCLGGFVLPWLQELKPDRVPDFDFKVPGVTSISADTHKVHECRLDLLGEGGGGANPAVV